MASKETKSSTSPRDKPDDGNDLVDEREDLVNASGHIQEIDRTFSIFSICSIGVLCDNAWGAGGGSLVVSLYNGGGPGVMYGLVASVFFYSLIAAGLAELASAIPSSACVYSWASVTAGPRYGRIVSFYAGWWNFLSWIFAIATTCLFTSQTGIALYSLYHPHYKPKRWQFFIVYLVAAWLGLALVLFGQRILARASGLMGVMLMTIWFVITMVCAIMPSQTGYGYATNSFVWKDFQNLTGWKSNGLVFIMGILNGAYAIGTPDGVCHLCEEIPHPKRNIPWAIFCQMATGATTTFCFYIAILYGVTDLNAVFNGRITALPLAGILQQAVRSDAATFSLLLLYFIAFILNAPSVYVNCGRMLWTLARDEAVPFSHTFRKTDARWRNPFNAQIACACLTTVLGLIYVADATAFTAFVGCFTIFTTWSYCAALLPHIISQRRNIEPGPFWMPARIAYPVIGTACAYILIFNIIYMFPYTYPVTVETMNYACVISGGMTLLLTLWYLWKRNHGYTGPSVAFHAQDEIVKGVVGLSWREEAELRRAHVSTTESTARSGNEIIDVQELGS